MYLIRPALPEDATALAALAERTFRATFAADNRAEDMDAHCSASYSPLRQAEEIARADGLTLLATTNGALIGFIQVRWGAAPPCIASTLAGEVQRLYVDTPWHGKGVANALLRDAMTVLRRQHLEHVWLGVWEHNPRARAFYRKFGFVDVGDHVFVLGADRQRDVLMARELVRIMSTCGD